MIITFVKLNEADFKQFTTLHNFIKEYIIIDENEQVIIKVF